MKKERREWRRRIKKSVFTLLFLIGIAGCSKQNQVEKDKVKKGETISISVSEEISPEIEVDIDGEFKTEDLKKYTVTPEPLPVEKDWVEGVAKYLPFQEKTAVEDKSYGEEYNTRLFYLKGQENRFSAQKSGIHVSIDPDFYENCELYYHGEGVYPFFNDEMDIYYDKKDLPFMTYQEAETLSKSLLKQAGFTYSQERSVGYSLNEDSLESYRSSHLEKFESIRNWWEENQIADYIENWRGTGGFYVFYYPLQIGSLQIDEGSMRGMTYAHVVINRDGIVRANIPCNYKVVEEADTEVVHPDITLERLLQMYENTILTGKIRISGIDLIFGETEMKVIGKSDLDILQVISPCWRFLVQMEKNGEMVDGEILYDAVTGKQIR